MPIRVTEPPIPLIRKRTSGCLRVPPAPIEQVRCLACGAENVEAVKVYVWAVTDERGFHYECDCCGRDFTRREFLATRAGVVPDL